ncbi:AzlD domain-containing protein [Vitiosangium sp. GDMCC 1.1324]|uniref:AzlD domain-containing protein n=1 Tax=Vitiosangium sp. (strain GDMCC 1.1324) TaxID=2138576 RepID=UPI000D37BF16|nr:AzlD domain-containing protein [Vitiosangium sp. GDMCC 1.1324]PTL84421.1 branched-chain amino acid transport [Vitiosangium sp. GDMCC 1.1324]
MNALPILLGMAGVTYASRLAGLWMHARVPAFWMRFLRFVPIAVFAALVVPALPGEHGETGARFLAAGLSALVSWRFRKLWLGLATGMAAYWLFR